MGGDPALAFGPDGTTLYYASIGYEKVKASGKRSKQKGKQGQDVISRIFVSPSTSLSPVTFGVPVAISGLTSGAAQDKELIAVDMTESSFRGRVYVAWSEFVDPPAPPMDLVGFCSQLRHRTTPLEFSPTHTVTLLADSPTAK